MKTIIIKKMLSTLLMASCLTTTPSFVSAANDGLGDSKPAAWAKNSQNELENDIKELDEVIADLKEKIEDYESDRDTKIKEIDGKIKLYSKKLKKLEKKLNPTSPRKKFKSLETKNLLKIIDRKLKRITKKLNSSCQCDDRLKKQFEFLKRKIERLLKEKESVESKFQENAQLEREQLKLFAANKSEKIKRYRKILKEKKPLDEKVSKDLKSKAHKLSQLSSDLLGKYLMLAKEHKVTLANDHKTNLMNLQPKVEALLSKDELDQKDRDEYNGMVDTYKILKQKVTELESQIESQRLLGQEKTKSAANLGSNELERKLGKQNQIKNSKHQPKESDQARQERELWQKINSGSQLYNLFKVQGNLCWLYSATNVLNYYNNIKNETPIKQYNSVTEKYRDKMGFDAAKANINGNMQEFPQISDYLEKSNLGFLQMTISTRSNKKELKEKLMNTVKDLLKTHFTESTNPSPVIIHQPSHFITIAGYDQKKDQFLIIDSLNFSFSSEDAKVEWKPAQKAFHTEDVNNVQTITLGFTSDSIPVPQSIILSINEQEAIIAHNLFPTEQTEQQISIDVLKSMIKNY